MRPMPEPAAKRGTHRNSRNHSRAFPTTQLPRAHHRRVLQKERLLDLYSGKWHLGDKPEAAMISGVYTRAPVTRLRELQQVVKMKASANVGSPAVRNHLPCDQ